jgi:hypothetical protein
VPFMSALLISILPYLSVGIIKVDGSTEIDVFASPDLGAGEKRGIRGGNKLMSMLT